MNAFETSMTSLFASTSFWDVGSGFWFTEKASTFAYKQDGLFMFIFWVSTFFFVLIVGLMTYFVFKHRRLPGVPTQRSAAHNTPLELAWTFLPLLLLVVMFVWGFRDYMYMHVAPADAEEIRLNGRQWSWEFTYDNGAQATESMRVADQDVPIVPVPQGRPIKMVMSSSDVIHSFYVPDFRVKMDVMPHRYTTVWFEVTSDPRPQTTPAGETVEYIDHLMFCAEYCGQQHSQMGAVIRVMPQAQYDAWKSAAADLFADRTPAEVGAILYRTKGCNACHSVDGSDGTGPTWLGVYGTDRRVLVNGRVETVEVDENYIRESIYVPAAKIAEGYTNQMVSYQGQINERELDAIIAYIKSLGPNGGGE